MEATFDLHIFQFDDPDAAGRIVHIESHIPTEEEAEERAHDLIKTTIARKAFMYRIDEQTYSAKFLRAIHQNA